MDPEGKNFGRGPRELTGAVDLISHYKLLPHHDFFCKRSLPLSISDTHYLHNVVGDTEIRKGEGMQLDQLIQNTSRDTSARIQPFDLDVLREYQKVSPKTRRGSIKSTKTKIRRRIESIRSTSTVIRIEVRIKTKTRIRRRIKAGIMIQVLIRQRNTTKRKGSMMEMKILMTFTGKKKHKSSKIDEVGAIKVAG